MVQSQVPPRGETSLIPSRRQPDVLEIVTNEVYYFISITVFTKLLSGPLEKLTSLIEDIFEAEDALSPDTDVSELNHDFFSTLSVEASRPRLCSSMIRKLIKYIGQVARPAKRQRQTTGTVLGTPRHKERMSDVDTQMLSRLMKILERTVQAGEDIDAFPYQPAVQSKSVSASPKKPSAKKSAKGKKTDRRSKSQSPQEEKEQPDAGDGETSKLGAIEFETLARSLDMARDSILAADCCIAILSSDRLTKQVCIHFVLFGWC